MTFEEIAKAIESGRRDEVTGEMKITLNREAQELVVMALKGAQALHNLNKLKPRY